MTHHAGADQRKDRCTLNQNGKADRRSLTKGYQKNVKCTEEQSTQAVQRETDFKAPYEAEHGRFQYGDYGR